MIITIEEKARAYDDALKKAKQFHDKDLFAECNGNLVEYIFPELAESEDKKIRKTLIEMFSNVGKKEWKDIPTEKIIAWLEKQGEKESDPRYKCLKELLAADAIYQMSMNDEMVQEAKEKAVNALSEMCIGRLLGLEKQGEPEKQKGETLSDSLVSVKNRVQPQSKQEWTEEDKKCIRLSTDIIDSALRAGFCVQLDRDRCIDWLKSLKPQNKWKPSDAQMQALKEACDKHWEPDGLDPLYTLYEQLKKL